MLQEAKNIMETYQELKCDANNCCILDALCSSDRNKEEDRGYIAIDPTAVTLTVKVLGGNGVVTTTAATCSGGRLRALLP